MLKFISFFVNTKMWLGSLPKVQQLIALPHKRLSLYGDIKMTTNKAPKSTSEECWKDAVGYEEYYLVSNKGRVWSKQKNKIMALSPNQNGYFTIQICRLNPKDGRVRKKATVHRIIAKTFLPNPLNKPQVNHKDGNKQNNSIENLEWATASENTWHATHIIKTNKPPRIFGRKDTPEQIEAKRQRLLGNNRTGKRVICLDNGRIFRSARHASLLTGKSAKYVSMCCRGIIKKEHWQYL